MKKRKWIYVQRPISYEISGCPHCGNDDCDWSEYEKHLWCANCEIDFIPEDNGVFDGPIPVRCAEMLGMCFDTHNIESGKIEKFEYGA
jgi:hypothetical protein